MTQDNENAVEREALAGWKLNHVQFSRDREGIAEIGYLDPEDDRFSPVVTVDTGLYYQPNDAVPLARMILDALATQPPAPADRVALAEELEDAIRQAIIDAASAAHDLSGAMGRRCADESRREAFALVNRLAASDAPPAAQPLTEEQIGKHTLRAGDCPPDSLVLLVSSVKRLQARLSSDTPPEESK
jgi:hypothetical protein